MGGGTEDYDFDSGTGFSPLLSFDTDDIEFARGFEAGRLWEALSKSQDERDQLVHATNVEMAMRIAEALGRPVRGEQLPDGWMRVVFGRPGYD